MCALKRGVTARTELATELWPDADPEVARTNLRTALHRVRKAAPQLMDTDGDSIHLSSVETDLQEADRLHR